ncbi:serine hydrolase domain-containing protein [Candidatus Eisenbacteria bacterium]|uniref:Serine hydrolase domain-containing protein n=1 Tax=Eiseniibacteriota bacterium TaxID=2212470 RepID=A0ABV6YJN9_UNCEI
MTTISARIREIVEKHHRERLFSGVIDVRQGNAQICVVASGLASHTHGIFNQENTRFQTASGCKIFTAVAICQLVESRLLSFETRLGDCLNVVFPNFDPNVTVHHLLTHSSGITSYFEEDVDPDYEKVWHDHPVYRMRNPADFLPLFQDKPMKFTPGDRFEYNDGGFILLGLIVERCSGMAFTSYVQESIFDPCGMQDSGYFATDQLPERTAESYIHDAETDTWRSNIFAVPIVGGPDGGAYTTAADMALFWQALLGDQLLEPSTRERMMTPLLDAHVEGEHLFYGYGIWMLKPADIVTMYYVTGWDPGVAQFSAYHPQEDVLITILGNTNRPIMRIHAEIIELIREADLGLKLVKGGQV